MFKQTLGLVSAVLLSVSSAAAATFTFDVSLLSITGPGAPDAFYSQQAANMGVMEVVVDESTPGDFNGTVELSEISVSGLLNSNAGTFFQKTFAHDPLTGTVTFSGFLGGLTGPYPNFLPSADQFAYVFVGASGGPVIDSDAALNAFMATVSGGVGYYEAQFFDQNSPAVFEQRATFAIAPQIAPIPLPAAGGMLILALGGLGLLRARRG